MSIKAFTEVDVLVATLDMYLDIVHRVTVELLGDYTVVVTSGESRVVGNTVFVNRYSVGNLMSYIKLLARLSDAEISFEYTMDLNMKYGSEYHKWIYPIIQEQYNVFENYIINNVQEGLIL